MWNTILPDLSWVSFFLNTRRMLAPNCRSVVWPAVVEDIGQPCGKNSPLALTSIDLEAMDPSAREEYPNLVSFLEDRLPELGLDVETYAPYVVGWTETEAEEREEALEGIMQLLQASSEEFSEDESLWTKLGDDIRAKYDKDTKRQEEQEAKEREMSKAALQEQLAQAKLEQEAELARAQERQQEEQNAHNDDAAKRALLDRFAYEQDEEEEEEEGMSNQQAAAQASLERSRELRSHKTQTKREAQQQTKEQKANKQQLKEERRKRTTKGERKR